MKNKLTKSEVAKENNLLRLQVFLARCGIASRRKCEEFIKEGRVSVDGEIVSELGTKVAQDAKVCFDGKPVTPEEKKVYVLLNKPKGYLCSLRDDFSRPLAVDLLKESFSERLYNVGRLDLYSSGAIIFTNDGEFAKIISHPSSEIEKEYFVETVFPFDEKILKEFMSGVEVDGIVYKCKAAKKLSSKKMMITLIEGKNREIRNVLKHFNVKIRQLTRLRIGNIELDGLPYGKFRELKKEEIKALLNLAKNYFYKTQNKKPLPKK